MKNGRFLVLLLFLAGLPSDAAAQAPGFDAGQYLRKWTWMAERVEVTGLVWKAREDDSLALDVGQPVGSTKGFDLQLDDNYKHLVSSTRGNNPLPFYCGARVPLGAIHVEADARAITSDPIQLMDRRAAWPAMCLLLGIDQTITKP